MATSHIMMLGACLLVCSSPAFAQTTPRIQPGDLVRVERLGVSGAVKGTVVRLGSDSLVVAPGDPAASRFAVARDDISNVWVSVGRRRQTWKGAGIGLAAGAGVGALLSGLAYEPCVPTEFMSCLLKPESAGQAALLGAAAGGVIGVVIGGIAGYATRTHVWQPIGVPTSVGFAPAREGRLAISFRSRI